MVLIRMLCCDESSVNDLPPQLQKTSMSRVGEQVDDGHVQFKRLPFFESESKKLRLHSEPEEA